MPMDAPLTDGPARSQPPVDSAFAEPSARPSPAGAGAALREAPRWAKLLLLPAVVSITLTVDQGSKILAQRELTVPQVDVVTLEDGRTAQVTHYVPARQVEVVRDLFHFRYVENPAAAFSLTSSMPEWFRKPFLVLVSMLAMVLILSWYWRTREPDWLILTSFALILGGALGNLVDRMAYGYVIDFIDWHLSIINPRWPHWPTFNVADIAIFVGTVLFAWYGVIHEARNGSTSAADRVDRARV